MRKSPRLFNCFFKRFEEQKLLPQFLNLFYSNFFLVTRKSCKKNKNPDGLTLSHFCFLLKVLAPPRAQFLLRQKLPGTAAHFYRYRIFLRFGKQSSVNLRYVSGDRRSAAVRRTEQIRKPIPRLAVPPNATSVTAGRGALFWVFGRTDKADKSCKDFCFFATFFSKKKVELKIKKSLLLANSFSVSVITYRILLCLLLRRGPL